ncbi:Glycosyl transferase family 2 [Devosia sp. LC5]|uniref:glucans biosynthesis glucosyltransferase MdoH n=1 Tax=Devosia sp. LC5 TaxID=1502724 RepID=UPI0004E37F98|nr:glucans biosynthesis glucosyltransferase MdoH [Devosia sp. LC5]KFC71333.1 Glycosyl transferase family 2 [Devosia sp. LC5]
MTRPILIRSLTLLVAVTLSAAGGYLFLRFTGEGGLTALDIVRAILVTFTSFWLVWGAAAAVLGVFAPARKPDFDPREKPEGLTAILVPIYNEDPVATFSRIAAMNRSLVALDIADRFHIAVLSDTTVLETAAQEVVWFEHLLREPMSAGRIFYRRREKNTGRKAGNIEDFIARSGGAYDYALILDADSLMEGATIGEMARRMDADDQLGLLQTVPQVINAATVFGRSMQFSACYMSPSFARGAALMQGSEGPYWGHNAIVRVSAFAASCGLPVLSGKPPYGGHILSHDYVEAALLSRAGWKVKVDPELGGSFEEGPENLIEYAKRDRRWCQGNLQHRRLIAAPGLKFWSRFTFVQGIMAYMASPLWLTLLFTSVLAALFPDQRSAFTGFGVEHPVPIWALGLGVAAVLVMPKLMILVRGAIDGRNRRFGGTHIVLLSIITEIAFSTVLAPVMLMLQSRAVMQVLLGLDGGWPPTRRGQNWISINDAFQASWWIVLTGVLALGSTAIFAPSVALWLAPAALPAIFAPLLISMSSHPSPAKRPLYFRTDSEIAPTPVMAEHQAIMAGWTIQGNPSDVAVARSAEHVAA